MRKTFTILLVCVLAGCGVDVKRLQQQAEQGDAEAQYQLGLCYANDKGVEWKSAEWNHAESAKWYRKAAEQGHVKAQYQLGSYYDSGWGEKNEAESFKWYLKAAEQGYAPAQTITGLNYRFPIRRDYAESLKWLHAAAEQGDCFAQNQLGFCYEHGFDGAEKNENEAIKWYHKAAQQGDSGAKEKLKKLGISSSATQGGVSWLALLLIFIGGFLGAGIGVLLFSRIKRR